MLAYFAVLAALVAPSFAATNIVMPRWAGSCMGAPQPKGSDANGEVPPPSDGDSVVHQACSFRDYQQFEIQEGETMVRYADSNLCLDAGSDMKEGAKLKFWTCYEGLQQQTWFYTQDGRIALKDSGMCITAIGDPSGKDENKILRLQKCEIDNKEQYWELYDRENKSRPGPVGLDGERGNSGSNWKDWVKKKPSNNKRRMDQ